MRSCLALMSIPLHVVPGSCADKEGQAASGIQPGTAARLFTLKTACTLTTVSKRLAYVLQDTDRRQRHAYDDFFALRSASRADRRMAGRSRNGRREAR